jgi:hypothetical protein
VKIVESEFLPGVSDVVDPASNGGELSGKLLSRGDFPFRPVSLDICGDREGGVELVRVRLGILGLPKLLDMSGSEFIVLLYGQKHRVSANFEHP